MAGKKIKKIVVHFELKVESGDSLMPLDLMQAMRHIHSQYNAGVFSGKNILTHVPVMSRRARAHPLTWTVTVEEEE